MFFDNFILEVSTNMQWLYLIIGLVVGVILGLVGMHMYYKLGLSAKQKQLEDDSVKAKAEAERIEAEAQKDAENRKDELDVRIGKIN